MEQIGHSRVVVIISANSEWRSTLSFYRPENIGRTPFGACFQINLKGQEVVFIQGGWGKISAAASTQYIIDHWQPKVVINLGTCGGIAGRIELGTILLVAETWVYDIYERMGDAQAALDRYSVKLDLAWLREPYPLKVTTGRLISGDQDIDPSATSRLVDEFDTAAADWESGAIAWVTQRNQVRCLILRGVSDLVSHEKGEVYGQVALFHARTAQIMSRLLGSLPGWLDSAI